MNDPHDLGRTCQTFRRNIDRRGFLHAGVLGTAGLSLPALLMHEAAAASAAKRDKSVILLWMRGGPSHIDMWDPKPDAPAEFSGEFGTMNTAVAGIQTNEILIKTAAILEYSEILVS